MIVRLADMETDALAIVDSVRDFISRMDYREFLPETDEDLTVAIGRLFVMEQVETLVAEHDGKIVGGLSMIYAPHIWNPKLLVGEELLWWATSDAPLIAAFKLLRTAQASARAKGAAVITFKALTSSPAGVDRVYRRMGLRQVETSYMGVP